MTPIADRTAQDLLAERRCLVQEMRRDGDPYSMIQAQIDMIDNELDRRNKVLCQPAMR